MRRGHNRLTRPHYPDHFPEVVEQFDGPDIRGDPARYLCTGDSLLARARIRGIRDETTVRVWIAVANALRQRGRLNDTDYWNVLGQLQERLEDLQTRPDEQVYRPVALDGVRAKRQRDPDRQPSASAKLADLRTDGGDHPECFRCGVSTPEEDLSEFDLPDGQTAPTCETCREIWDGRTFIVGGGSA